MTRLSLFAFALIFSSTNILTPLVLAVPKVGDLAPSSCRFGSDIGRCTCAWYYFKGRKTLLNCHWAEIYPVPDPQPASPWKGK
jgi:hypothetical protein